MLVLLAERVSPEVIPPALPAMFSGVVEHLTALAQCGEIGRRVAAKVMIKVRAGKPARCGRRR
jgi:hypothetical protein